MSAAGFGQSAAERGQPAAEPAQPVVAEPAQPVVAEPAQPVVAEPAQPVVAEPAQPVVAEPAQPVVAEPAQPVVAEPAQPVVAEPAQPVVAERGQTAAERGQTAAERGQTAAERGQTAAELGQPAAERGQTAAERGQPAAAEGERASAAGSGGFPYPCHRPAASSIPKWKMCGRNYSFVSSLFQKYPWIDISKESQTAFCALCRTFERQHPEAPCLQRAFTRDGFGNWKDGAKLLKGHQQSKYHRGSFAALVKQKPIHTNITSAVAKSQAEAAEALQKIITSIMLLARQGLALRGHESGEGNLRELLELRAEDSFTIKEWLKRSKTYLHPDIQNELLGILSHHVLRDIIREMTESGPTPFALIVDGSQDVSGVEQQTICVRYVTPTLDVQEEFVGFYEPPSTTGEALARMMEDAMLRLGLSMDNLRGLAFDGAANMKGQFRGAQALLRAQQPLALYVHCGAHCLKGSVPPSNEFPLYFS